jgi:hypothetical protein
MILPDKAPKVTLDGRTVAIGAIDDGAYSVRMYELIDSKWEMILDVVSYNGPNSVINDIKAKGGAVIQWLVEQLNKAYASIFGVDVQEPTTDAEARAQITKAVTSMTVDIANNIPVVKK